MALEIIREDITRVKVDAIVNPTDEYYTGLGGTDGRIHEAGGIKLREACDRLPSLSAGECIVTDSFNMDNCRYIIHTVGPVYVNGHHNEAVTLARCYISVLREAVNLKVKSIALPLISTGTFGYPKKEALSIATRVIREFLYDYELDVYLLVYDREAFDISRELYDDVDDYLSDYGFELESGYGDIDEYEDAYPSDELKLFNCECKAEPSLRRPEPFGKSFNPGFMKDYVEDESFNDCLRRFISEKHKTEKDVYTASNLSKQAFNGIYNNKSVPKKGNVLALCIGLQLDIDEAMEFVEKAGYSFGYSKQDYIVRYFIENERYDIFEINYFLMNEDLPYLGSKYE